MPEPRASSEKEGQPFAAAFSRRAALVALLAERQGYMDAAARIKADRAAVRDTDRIEDVVAKVKAAARAAGIEEREMLRTFNCGIGLIVVADPSRTRDIIDAFLDCGQTTMAIGALVAAQGDAQVVYRGALKL